tara:strand:+ start:233 stop:415 length:183 start_codon:yes stop_codon:yes gene_type:complete
MEADKVMNEIRRVGKEIENGLPYTTISGKIVKLPNCQACGTYYQRKTHAMIKAREIINGI